MPEKRKLPSSSDVIGGAVTYILGIGFVAALLILVVAGLRALGRLFL